MLQLTHVVSQWNSPEFRMVWVIIASKQENAHDKLMQTAGARILQATFVGRPINVTQLVKHPTIENNNNPSKWPSVLAFTTCSCRWYNINTPMIIVSTRPRSARKIREMFSGSENARYSSDMGTQAVWYLLDQKNFVHLWQCCESAEQRLCCYFIVFL